MKIARWLSVVVVAIAFLGGCASRDYASIRPITNVISLEVTDTYTIWQMIGGAVSRMDITNNIAGSRMVVSVDEHRTIAIPPGGQAFVFVRFAGRSSANVSVVARFYDATGNYTGVDTRNMYVSQYPRADSWVVSNIQTARGVAY